MILKEEEEESNAAANAACTLLLRNMHVFLCECSMHLKSPPEKDAPTTITRCPWKASGLQ
jgi:hypothetical protein